MTNASATKVQIAEIAALLASKDWSNQKTVPAKYISRASVINLVISIANGELAESWSPVMENYGIKLSDSIGHDVNVLLAECGEDANPNGAYAWAPLTEDGADKMIEWLVSLRNKVSQQPQTWSDGSVRKVSPAVEIEDGMYRRPADGEIFKVYKTQRGFQVAKRLVVGH